MSIPFRQNEADLARSPAPADGLRVGVVAHLARLSIDSLSLPILVRPAR